MERKCALKVQIAHSDAFLRMDMEWYQLVFHSPFRLDDALIFSFCFIIQNLEVHQHITVLMMLHDGVVCEQSVFVGARLEGGGNDSIGVTIIRNRYILISAAQVDRKSSSIISIYFSDLLNPDVKFIGVCRITRDV